MLRRTAWFALLGDRHLVLGIRRRGVEMNLLMHGIEPETTSVIYDDPAGLVLSSDRCRSDFPDNIASSDHQSMWHNTDS